MSDPFVKSLVVKSLVLILLSACAHSEKKVTPPLPAPLALPALPHVKSGCRVYDLAGHPIRSFAGSQCLFFKDGSYLVGSERDLALIDANQETKWKHSLFTNHILTETSHGDFLVNASEIHKLGRKRVRYGVLHKFSHDGRELGRFSMYDHRKEFLDFLHEAEAKALKSFGWEIDVFPDVKFEFSHINSYYEIPNYGPQQIEGLRPGSIIVNTIFPKNVIFVISPDLSRIESLHLFEIPQVDITMTHDVQVLPNGHVLLYNNLNSVRPTVFGKATFSSLDEFDPSRDWKLVWRYTEHPTRKFASPFCGGVQLLDNGHIFFSDISGQKHRVREIERSGKDVLDVELPIPPGEVGGFIGMQDAKRVDLTEFLKNNMAP
jgi:hypothetical protein